MAMGEVGTLKVESERWCRSTLGHPMLFKSCEVGHTLEKPMRLYELRAIGHLAHSIDNHTRYSFYRGEGFKLNAIRPKPPGGPRGRNFGFQGFW